MALQLQILLQPSPKTLFLPSSFDLSSSINPLISKTKSLSAKQFTSNRFSGSVTTKVAASLIESPLLWAGKLCVFYALIKTGLVGSEFNPLISSELVQPDVDEEEVKEVKEKRKMVSKWHPTKKGTLKRNFKVPSKAHGQKLLKTIADFLSEDDHFIDVTSHKGCRIRRESAHGESVCCNNVRALFDELPTPHLVLEITAFPAGPLTESDYLKAERLERVLLRSGSFI
ncbi:hypothetical protein LUZ60_006438 [Juncus effusus]|nr:hypothetical protein LUZ60_006438 [Juncus effusus]